MQHKTNYIKSKAREATEEERCGFMDRTEYWCITLQDFFGMGSIADWEARLDKSKEPALAVFDGYFCSDGRLDGRLLIATFLCKDGSRILVRFGWIRSLDSSCAQCVLLGGSEIEQGIKV